MKAAVVVFLTSACFKLLLFRAYKSTDFEVHRNWLAVTYSSRPSQWYFEDTSEWTLDYPPLFAAFEWLLSQVAVFVDANIVDVYNQGYSSLACVLFQRCTVIISELVLMFAVIHYCQYKEKEQPSSQDGVDQQRILILSFQLLANCGLLMVDHIHFQYNGFLFGFLLLSITSILKGHHISGAIWFSILLNLKHIFLYIAPVYFVYLLKNFCYKNSLSGGRLWRLCVFLGRFIILGLVVTAVFVISFACFYDHVPQVFNRLFPFKRGLCHAYWAPNVWSLYSATDVLLSALGKVGGLNIGDSSSMTSGLVGEMQLRVLPNVHFLVTAALSIIAMLPALSRLLLKPSTPQDFLRCLVLCAYASFLFGWHVHEKAILMITIPLCLCALEELRYLRIYLVLSTAAYVSLFPLLNEAAETPIKISYFILFTSVTFITLPEFIRNTTDEHQEPPATPSIPTTPSSITPSVNLDDTAPGSSSSLSSSFPLTTLDCYLLGIVFLTQVYYYVFYGVLASFPFLPLLLTSVSCALVVLWTWLLMYKEFWRDVKITKLD